MSNERQLSLACHMYFDDIKGFFTVGGADGEGYGLWMTSLTPYIAQLNTVRLCAMTPLLSTNDTARHGSVPSSGAPRVNRASQTMPGAVNIAFFDGHVELIPLESLWSLYWSRSWVPSVKPP
jgi:prepilin-type processing-associated H-X9-DG protein